VAHFFLTHSDSQDDTPDVLGYRPG